ncbi:MAG: hypothetical protein IT557_15860 [Alphaproteobacteria bacterium]|nr:hypothetical protein [Alphaproteobacteria bacterium]
MRPDPASLAACLRRLALACACALIALPALPAAEALAQDGRPARAERGDRTERGERGERGERRARAPRQQTQRGGLPFFGVSSSASGEAAWIVNQRTGAVRLCRAPAAGSAANAAPICSAWAE